jgi:hypothetical protein
MTRGRLSGSLNQCIWCGHHYAGAAAYGLHFHPVAADCLSPDAKRDIGMTVSRAGFWTIERSARPVEHAEARDAL